jgi:hypothetical protein
MQESRGGKEGESTPAWLSLTRGVGILPLERSHAPFELDRGKQGGILLSVRNARLEEAIAEEAKIIYFFK